MRPYYQDDHATLYLGDCREIAPQLQIKVNLLLADPPYGDKWNPDYQGLHCNRRPERRPRRLQKAANRWPPIPGDDKPFDPRPWLAYRRVILWGANRFAQHLPVGRLLVWDKRHKSGKSVLSHGEVAWMKGGRGVWIHPQTWVGLFREGDENGTRVLHPTQKPVALMRWCMTYAGSTATTPRRGIDCVLDPYAGSGTTLVAAKEIGKQAVGIELAEWCCEVAARRLERTRAGEVPA